MELACFGISPGETEYHQAFDLTLPGYHICPAILSMKGFEINNKDIL